MSEQPTDPRETRLTVYPEETVVVRGAGGSNRGAKLAEAFGHYPRAVETASGAINRDQRLRLASLASAYLFGVEASLGLPSPSVPRPEMRTFNVTVSIIYNNPTSAEVQRAAVTAEKAERQAAAALTRILMDHELSEVDPNKRWFFLP